MSVIKNTTNYIKRSTLIRRKSTEITGSVMDAQWKANLQAAAERNPEILTCEDTYYKQQIQ